MNKKTQTNLLNFLVGEQEKKKDLWNSNERRPFKNHELSEFVVETMSAVVCVFFFSTLKYSTTETALFMQV